MKTSIYLTITLFFFTITSTFSQAQFGIRGGATITNWKGFVDSSVPVDYKIKMGGYIGVGAKLPISKKVELHFATDLSMKGHVLSGVLNDGRDVISGSISTQSIYLDTPISLNAFIDDKFYIKGGGVFSSLISNKYSTNLRVNDLPVKEKVDTKDSINSFDYSYLLGFGYKSSNGTCIEITYESSLNNIISDPSYLVWHEAWNKVIRVGVSHYFDKSKSNNK